MRRKIKDMKIAKRLTRVLGILGNKVQAINYFGQEYELTDIIAASFTRFLISAPEKPTVRKTSCRVKKEETVISQKLSDV